MFLKFMLLVLFFSISNASNISSEHKEIKDRFYRNGVNAFEKKNYHKALNYFLKFINIQKKSGYNYTEDSIVKYTDIAKSFEEAGKYRDAIIFYKEALNIYIQEDPEHDQIAIINENIGYLYYLLQDYHLAIKYANESLESKKRIFGNDDITLSASYHNLSVLYQAQGDYLSALKYQKKSLLIKKDILGENDISISKDYNGIAQINCLMGNYVNALKYYRKALKIKKNILGNNHPDILNIYNSIAIIYHRLGNNIKGLSFLQKVENIYKNKQNKINKLLISTTYNNLGLLYHAEGNYAEALKYYKNSIQIKEKILGSNHIDIAVSYNNIAGLYDYMGDYKKALINYKKALSIREKILDKNHPSIATSYSNIGSLYAMMKKYEKAKKYIAKSLHIQKYNLDPMHPFIGSNYNKMGWLYIREVNYLEAYHYAKKAFDNFLINRDMVFNILSSKQKKLYLKDNSERVPLLLASAYLYKTKDNKVEPKVNQEVFNNWLHYKGSIFDSENAIATLYANTTDKILKEKIDNLGSSKRYLATLYQTLPKPKERKTWQENIKQTKGKIASLTKAISQKAQSFKEQQGLKDISYIDIAKNLKEDELYIDYAKAGEYYYLFTLDREEHITFEQIDSSESKAIETLVKTFREDITSILNDNNMSDESLKQLTIASKEKLSKLYKLIVASPLKGVIESKKSLIISPDSALKLLPFEALYDTSKSSYLIEQKNIRYIPSGKELLRLYKYRQTNTTKKSKEAVVFSNPNFDAKDVHNISKEMSITPNTNRAGIIKSLFRMHFSPLPGTKAEAQNIKETLIRSGSVKEYKAEEASEANLLQVKQPKILHIATHGFFINDNTVPNPMLKSGIALSGANASAIKGKSDGIVTALKLSGLKLKGTELVVLSACETGTVDINSTDAVSGLSKSFIQAGAKNIVMSLWSVNDQATQELMSSFYKEIQTQPNYATALKEAKLKMIKQNKHPFFWGAFVVNGL